jgi:predicted NBD/HSP70 family sugar kinase
LSTPAIPVGYRHPLKPGEEMKIIGVDVGGTLTDLVYCYMAGGEVAIHKVATTPDDPPERDGLA